MVGGVSAENWHAALDSDFKATHVEYARSKAGTLAGARPPSLGPREQPEASRPHAHQIEPRWKSSSGAEPVGLAKAQERPTTSHRSSSDSRPSPVRRRFMLSSNVSALVSEQWFAVAVAHV